MSLTLAAVADALIEFILSLLRDPEARAEFEQDPDAVLAQRGLHHVSPSDVQAVAPIIIEQVHVVHVPMLVRQQHESHHSNPVVREIHQVSNNFAWVDDRDTIVDQSVNQNIWADGDVTQTFDNHAVVASGDDAIAAGGGVDVDETTDQSTTIDAGEDVNIGNDTDVTTIDDSYGDETDDSTTTDASTDIQVDGSANDESTVIQVSDSADDQTDAATTTVAANDTAVDGSAEVQVEDPASTTAVEEPVYDTAVEAPVEAEPEQAPDAAYSDSAAQYTELDADVDTSEAFDQAETVLPEESGDGDF